MVHHLLHFFLLIKKFSIEKKPKKTNVVGVKPIGCKSEDTVGPLLHRRVHGLREGVYSALANCC